MENDNIGCVTFNGNLNTAISQINYSLLSMRWWCSCFYHDLPICRLKYAPLKLYNGERFYLDQIIMTLLNKKARINSIPFSNSSYWKVKHLQWGFHWKQCHRRIGGEEVFLLSVVTKYSTNFRFSSTEQFSRMWLL